MELTNLNKLKRDNSGLYDLFVATYKHVVDVPFFEYVVNSDEEMRVDLVSKSIYDSVNYTEFILDYNNIDNPLNIKAGDTIVYISLDYIESTIVAIHEADYVPKRAAVILNNIDSSREEYNNNNGVLTPTTKRTPNRSVTINGDTIKVGGNNN